MKKMALFLIFILFNLSLAGNRIMSLEVNSAIGPATVDYIQSNIQMANNLKYNAVIIKLDTPGGLLKSTRMINQTITNSQVPVISYVHPTGAHASSAGTFILLASHIAAMSPGTHIGAATPINMLSTNNKDTNNAMSSQEKKAINSTVSYIRSLAKLHNRNEDWAEKAVKEAHSINDNEALKLNVIDVVANNVTDLLEQINGKTVQTSNDQIELQTSNVSIDEIDPTWQNELLKIFTDPSMAYLLMMAGIYGIILELSNPGAALPGVAGVICLMLALYAFQMLPVNYAGVGLILFGILLMIGELMTPSFGVLAIGGLISFTAGSLLLYNDPIFPELRVAYSIIIATALFTLGIVFVVLNLVIRSTAKKVTTGAEALLGIKTSVRELSHGKPQVVIQGEYWSCTCDEELKVNDDVIVESVKGNFLVIKKINDQK